MWSLFIIAAILFQIPQRRVRTNSAGRYAPFLKELNGVTRAKDVKTGIVLQAPFSDLPEKDRPTYGDWGTTKTVIIPSDLDKLRQYPRIQIFAESERFGRRIPPEVVNLWGLKEGDLIHYRGDLNDGHDIVSVNEIVDPRVVVSLPTIVGIGENRLSSHYPIRPFPVELYDEKIHWDQDYEPVLRAITLRAPLGFGHGLWVAGPGEVGKTSALRAVWRSAIRMTGDRNIYPNLYVIACIAGERDEDFTDFKTDMYNTRPKDLARVELYASTEDDPAWCWVQMAEVFVKRARRLVEAGYDVVAFLDSGTKVVMGHSRRPETEGPWIHGGIATASLDFATQLLAVKGHYVDNQRPNGDKRNRSLTSIISVLLDPPGEHTTESYFAQEKMHSLSTAKWVFNEYHLADHPKLDVTKTSSRRVKRFASKAHLAEMKAVDEKMWNGNEPSNRWRFAAAELNRWVANNPKVTYYE